MNYKNLTKLQIKQELCKRSFLEFVLYTMPNYEVNFHHKLLCEYLDNFVNDKIKKLMVFMPPQHGKSELASRRLPSYLLGINPTLKIIGASYSAELSRQFNRSVQRIIDTKEYANIFPNTTLNNKNTSTDLKRGVLRNADIFEIVEHLGFYKSVGVGGALTGTPADIAIIDDPVKDPKEATSLAFQIRNIDWYNSVLNTRLHNNSKVLLTMTRWDKNDLAGKILEQEKGQWEVLKLEGLKSKIFHIKDPREVGDALWESKHSKARLLNAKNSNERTFNALYQQDPSSSTKMLIFSQYDLYDFDKIDAEVFYGLDFGFSSDELAFVGCKIVDNKVYAKVYIYDTNITNTILIERLNILGISKGDFIYCDHLPDRIKELTNAGFKAVNARKGQGSIISSILNLDQYYINIDPNSTVLKYEIDNYKYKESADGVPLPEVAKSKDHAIDALRMAVYTRTYSPNYNITKNDYQQNAMYQNIF